MSLGLRYAAASDVGLRREGNEDSGYAGPRILAIADGVGGAAAGEVASSVTIAHLAELDEDAPGPDLLGALRDKALEANAELDAVITENAALDGMSTTLTALLWDGSRMGLAHIGDSRGYLLRDGELSPITRDHTLVQSLVDEGRLSVEEASVHPQRSMILRAIDGHTEPELDLTIRETRLGDRYLLCSDGLSDVVSDETIRETLTGTSPQDAVDRLIDLALRGGGPDNVTCVVADVVNDVVDAAPVVVGAAATRPTGRRALMASTPAGRAALAARPDVPEDAPPAPKIRARRRWGRIVLAVVAVVLVLGGAAGAGWAYVRTQYFVGTDDGKVTVFRGVAGSVAGLSLHTVHERTGIPVSLLPGFERERVNDGITAHGATGARHIVDRLRLEACQAIKPTPKPTPTPSRSPRQGRHRAATGTPTATPAPTSRPSVTPAPTPSTPTAADLSCPGTSR